MKRWQMVLGVFMSGFGGYWYGFIYAPQRWNNKPVGDVAAVLIGCLGGWLLFLLIILFIESWRSAK